ncbi:Putative HMP/thiamine import ATP-binding protein YkoD [Clostridiales bacterium CHKCI001]|nr:Putative HMP/thiamine import ATP-binding protein YkoD [Clostridiales bacterium CHKCI001]
MISIKNVNFSYSGTGQGKIENINLDIPKGNCVLLCGRSGCGKTTITRLVNGLIPYFYEGNLSGTVTVDGMNIAETPMYKIAEKVGSVFQNPRSQFFNTDTDSEIAFGMENMAWPLKKMLGRIKETTKDINIENLCERNIAQLSGGEKQKVAFASVYAMTPDIFVLDEPSSSLDVDAIQELRNLLLLLKNNGKTILISEHRLYFLKGVIDKAVYIEGGKIQVEYTPEELFSLPDDERIEKGLRSLDLIHELPSVLGNKNEKSCFQVNRENIMWGKEELLKNISFTAAKGDIIGVIGHNGSGKTTFSRTICGLHKYHTGEYLWNNKKVDDKQRLKFCYMVMQNVSYQLFSDTVEKESCFGIKNPDKDLANQTLKELGLSPYLTRHPNTLSGGQKQRLAVAVSMICHKDLLVFDEPTSGLDFDSMCQVSDLVKKLAAQGKVLFIVTHDYEFLTLTCNRILHFDDAQLVEDYKLDSESVHKLWSFFDLEGVYK